MVGGLRIEIAGRLVGQQNTGAIGDRAGDSDALLLAAPDISRSNTQRPLLVVAHAFVRVAGAPTFAVLAT
jgi:hypothetical protein